MRSRGKLGLRAYDRPIEVGKYVFVRNRKVRGRNKIQDHWDATPHKVVAKPQDTVYTVVEADGQGSRRTVSRTEIREDPGQRDAPQAPEPDAATEASEAQGAEQGVLQEDQAIPHKDGET